MGARRFVVKAATKAVKTVDDLLSAIVGGSAVEPGVARTLAKELMPTVAGFEKLAAPVQKRHVAMWSENISRAVAAVKKNPDQLNAIMAKFDDDLAKFGGLLQRTSGAAVTKLRGVAALPELRKWSQAYRNPNKQSLGVFLQEAHKPEVLSTMEPAVAKRIEQLLRKDSLEGERNLGYLAEVVQFYKQRGWLGKSKRHKLGALVLGAFEAQAGMDVGLMSPSTWKASPALRVFQSQAARQTGARQAALQPKPGLLRRGREYLRDVETRPWLDPTKLTGLALAAGYGAPAVLGATGAIREAGAELPDLQAELLREQTVNSAPTVAELLLGQTLQEGLISRSQRMGTAVPSGAYVPSPQHARGVIKLGGGVPGQAQAGQQNIASLLLGLDQMKDLGG